MTRSLLCCAFVAQAFGGAGPTDWTGNLDPISSADWNYDLAAHLLERAGFGGTPEEIDHLAAMTPEAAVAYLVDYESIDAAQLADYDESGIWDEAMIPDADQHMDFGVALRKAYREGEVYGRTPAKEGERPYQEIINTLYTKYFTSNREWNRVAVWWAERMLNTPRPLEEKMALFWHGHFATEEQKLDDYRLMLNQNRTLRRLATGNFRDLLVAVSQDPAMLVYLDNRMNVNGHANENYAREVMELFGLGVGNYTEDDVKEAARAFTGWRNEGLRFVNDPALHDGSEKTIFDQTGNFDGYSVIDLILAKKVCAEYIAGKLYRYFAREDLSPELRERLGNALSENNYEIGPLLKLIFLSKDFYSPASFATQIKGPVQFYVSACRKLGLDRIPGTPYFTQAMAGLGQSLGNPPNVKGWDGGRAWVNPSTLLQRGNIMRHLLFPDEAVVQYPRYVIPERYRFAQAEAEERDMLAASGASADMGGEMIEGGTMAGSADANMMAPAAKLINSAPDYDLKLGVYNAIIRSFERVKDIPPVPAQLSVMAMVRSSGAKTPGEAVEYFEKRFLRLALAAEDKARIVAFLTQRNGGDQLDYGGDEFETALRETLHLIMSTPEFQLS